MSQNMDRKGPLVRLDYSDIRIRLLVLDIDGTIADESDHIEDSVIQTIHSLKRLGVAVAIATGRGFELSLPAYNSIGSTLPLICHEGALIKEPGTGLVHRHWSLPRRVAGQVLDRTERLSRSGRVSVHFYVEDRLYVSNLNSAAIRYFAGAQIEPIVMNDLRQLLTRATTKVRVLSDDSELIARLSDEMDKSHSRVQLKEYRSLTFLEVDHPSVNKLLAVSYLAEEIMGLRPANVMAIGDDFTDIEVLRYAGIGVAMGNAPGAVKASADWVTTTIEEDGVAVAIKAWILRSKSPAPSSTDDVT